MARIATWGITLVFAVLLTQPRPVEAQEYFSPAELTEQPALKSPQQAQEAILRAYPKVMRDAGIGGKVQVRFVIGPDGKVVPSTIEVVAASAKALGEAAAKAVAEIEFKPGRKDGQPVPAMVIMPIVFGAS